MVQVFRAVREQLDGSLLCMSNTKPLNLGLHFPIYLLYFACSDVRLAPKAYSLC